MLLRYLDDMFWSGEFIEMCSIFGIAEKARMNDGIFVAAWKIGGYCWMRTSSISQDPYFGAFSLVGDSTCGTYVKLSCSPLNGSKIGGRNASAECGALKLNFFTWRPILFNVAIRPGLVNDPTLKFTVISLKTYGEAVEAKLWQTRRKAGRVSLSTLRKKALRQFSFNQNFRKVGLVDKTRLQTELFEQLAELNIG